MCDAGRFSTCSGHERGKSGEPGRSAEPERARTSRRGGPAAGQGRHGRSVLAAAEAFARAHHLPATAAELTRDGAADPADSGGLPVPDALDALLRRPRAKEVSWWSGVARGWRDAGPAELARASASTAWRLVHEGATAEWDELQALAEILAKPEIGRAAQTPARLWQLERESIEAKRNRIGLLFGHGPRSDVGSVISELTEREDIERLIMGTKPPWTLKWSMIAHAWHRDRDHRLATDQLFMSIAGCPLQSWLASQQETLVWCGWAFHRTGDQATAHACFTLALALEDGEALRAALRA